MPKGGGQSTQLCWSCLNAVPNVEIGRGCEWSRLLQPVPGWDAEMVVMREVGPTWAVRGCPRYEVEPVRKGRVY